MINRFKNGSGFTLVELMISMAIIAILSVIGLAGYKKFYERAEDSQKRSDLKLIQSALENYRTDQGYYPLKGTGACPGTTTTDGLLRFGCSLRDPNNKRIYLNKVPISPGAANYDYEVTGNTYCLYAYLNQSQPDTDMLSACDNKPGYNLEVTSP